jgi:hypothetical protein
MFHSISNLHYTLTYHGTKDLTNAKDKAIPGKRNILVRLVRDLAQDTLGNPNVPREQARDGARGDGPGQILAKAKEQHRDKVSQQADEEHGFAADAVREGAPQ